MHTVESRPMEISIQNFGMVQRLWDRRTDSIPIKVEVLEVANRSHFKKKVALTGANYNRQEKVQVFDQFLSPNYLAHQVNGWVAKVKNKSVRKAVWDVNGVRELCRLVPTSSCVESNVFRLGGLDAVRLVLYPNGIDDIPMQCAVFLKSCSEENSCTVRAMIAVNSVAKVFQGDLRASLGKKKFCSLNNCERIRITVEIQEIAEHAIQLRTIKKYEKLEEVFRLPDAGGISSYANAALSTRPLTSAESGGSRPGTGEGLGEDEKARAVQYAIPEEENHPYKAAFS